MHRRTTWTRLMRPSTEHHAKLDHVALRLHHADGPELRGAAPIRGPGRLKPIAAPILMGDARHAWTRHNPESTFFSSSSGRASNGEALFGAPQGVLAVRGTQHEEQLGRGVNMGRMEGKVALVTGAAGGPGRAHAIRLACPGRYRHPCLRLPGGWRGSLFRWHGG